MTQQLQAEESGYALGRDRAETARLRRQAVELREQTLALLGQVQLRRGASALDLGCGPLGILDLLSDRVGPSGRVVGMDSDPAQVSQARELVRERELGNVEVIEGDARHVGLPPSSFDLVHARTLLVTVARPEEVAEEMGRLAKPGGYVALHEPDIVNLAYPPCSAWDRLYGVFRTAFNAQGADLSIGRRLPHILRGAGMVDVKVEARADMYALGHTRRTVMPDLVRGMRPKIVELGLMSEGDLEALDRDVRAYLDDPNTLVLPHLFFLASGRKPV